MKIYEIPSCEKCITEKAIGKTNGMWLCGRCIEKFVKMMSQQNKDLFLIGGN